MHGVGDSVRTRGTLPRVCCLQPRHGVRRLLGVKPPVKARRRCSREQLVQALDLVRGHRVAVLGLGIAALAHVVGEGASRP